MSEIVSGIGVIGNKVVAWHRGLEQVGMAAIDSGVEHRHQYIRRSSRQIPSRWCLDFREMPLRTREDIRIIRNESGLGQSIAFSELNGRIVPEGRKERLFLAGRHVHYVNVDVRQCCAKEYLVILQDES